MRDHDTVGLMVNVIMSHRGECPAGSVPHV